MYKIELTRYDRDTFFTYSNLILKKDDFIVWSGKALEQSPLNPKLANIKNLIPLHSTGEFNLYAGITILNGDTNQKYLTAQNSHYTDWTLEELEKNSANNPPTFSFVCNIPIEGLFYGCIPITSDYFNILLNNGTFNFQMFRKEFIRESYLSFFKNTGLASALQNDVEVKIIIGEFL